MALTHCVHPPFVLLWPGQASVMQVNVFITYYQRVEKMMRLPQQPPPPSSVIEATLEPAGGSQNEATLVPDGQRVI
jgi:hypothetical protein